MMIISKLLHRNTFILIIACGLVYLFINLSKTSQTRDKSNPETPLQSSPTWFAKDISTIMMNDDGQPEKLFAAKVLQHYENSQTTEITDPLFSFYSKERALWRAKSKYAITHHGKSLADIDRLDLWDNVEIWRENEQKPVNIYTSQLSIFPEQKFAQTEQHVLMTQPGQKLEGDGLETYFDQGWVTLQNNVRGQHEAILRKKP